MAGALTPIPRYRAVDEDGQPLAGAKLYTYAAGTSTPQATYSDSALGTPNTNPVVAGADGLFGPIYLSAASYKFLLATSADVTVWSQDNVYDLWQIFQATVQDANEVYAGPASGAPAAPTFRALVAADLGTGTASVETFLRGDLTWATGFAQVCQGRLTLTTAVPVTTADVTGATTIYFTPYAGNRVALYNGTNWTLYSFTERSLALGTLTSGLNYDVFLYDNAGTLTLELTAWTNDSTRATALTTQDGVYVRSGATTRRYLGTLRTTSTTATEDSFAKRFVWNYYNRVPRPMRVIDATNSWTYTTATWRQANAAGVGTANQLAFVVGVAEVPATATVLGIAENTDTGVVVGIGIGADSTNQPSGQWGRFTTAITNGRLVWTASYGAFPAAGYHFYAWLEFSVATGTTTWIGDSGGTNEQSGIAGMIEG